MEAFFTCIPDYANFCDIRPFPLCFFEDIRDVFGNFTLLQKPYAASDIDLLQSWVNSPKNHLNLLEEFTPGMAL